MYKHTVFLQQINPASARVQSCSSEIQALQPRADLPRAQLDRFSSPGKNCVYDSSDFADVHRGFALVATAKQGLDNDGLEPGGAFRSIGIVARL